MTLQKIDHKSEQNAAHDGQSSFAERFFVPILWAIGWFSGWLACLAWYHDRLF